MLKDQVDIFCGFRIKGSDSDLEWRVSKMNCESAASSLITIFRTFSKVN